MTTPKFNSKSPTIRRIRKEAARLSIILAPLADHRHLVREAQELSNSPSPDYTAAPLESDLFEWHFTFRGPPNSSYSDGIYHGRIVLPPTYPLRPPSFRFLTPSGRFETNREICLSISGHHEETWQPAWGVRTALVALRSFMETDPRGQLGGLETSDAVRKRHAAASHMFKCQTCAKTNLEIIQECEESAKAVAGTSESNEVGIPSELKMSWKDEMAKPKGSEEGSPAPDVSQREEGDTESAELAEGFVRTAPETGLEANQVPASTSAPPAARLTEGVPAPTRTVSLPPAPNVRQVHQGPHDEGVPLWVDRSIVAIVVLLLAMIVKMVLDF
ncbi:ubiquitin-conjugating enzyme [Colletotrichum karsti]|uniref:Ubiquitin-conjugating enzyme n=1 Tax=Colletotrichum karsti TaxID=1095194 RepID=A0A9P6LDR3_9PEZI|nr:ubiquitin-conjugating enzyme [Colletotrichum karsti]KAF9869458.1 ubiquitin-conjugating enzyme [Colletotrichum karsti]